MGAGLPSLRESMSEARSVTDNSVNHLRVRELQDRAFQGKNAEEDNAVSKDEAHLAGDGGDPKPASFDELGVRAARNAYVVGMSVGIPTGTPVHARSDHPRRAFY